MNATAAPAAPVLPRLDAVGASLAPLAAVLVLAAVFTGGARAASPPGGEDPAATMAHAHAHDTPVPSPAVGRAGGGEETVARTVTYAHVAGKAVQGALARPANATKGGPAVILVHEWWGLNDNIRDVARQLASHGYTALAVDLYGGQAATTPDQAKTLMSAVLQDPASAGENLKQAYRYLVGEGAGKVGVIGWCFGGGWSLQTALLLPADIDATVIYYGRLETDPAKLAPIQGPILGLFGENDTGIPVATVRQFESALKGLHKDVTIRIFPGAGHAFANPSGTAYVKAAADEAWTMTLAFLDEHLKR
jgi:carboxymethylenebutenolidase